MKLNSKPRQRLRKRTESLLNVLYYKSMFFTKHVCSLSQSVTGIYVHNKKTTLPIEIDVNLIEILVLSRSDSSKTADLKDNCKMMA